MDKQKASTSDFQRQWEVKAKKDISGLRWQVSIKEFPSLTQENTLFNNM